MNIPNKMLKYKGNTLKVVCKLYSLASRSRVSRNGYEVCIKLETLASACGISVSTVSRAVDRLENDHVITNKYRITKSNGYQGCCHYCLALFADDKYFYMRNDIFSFVLTAQQFTVYAHMCKLRTNYINSFYQSLNDLSRIIGMDKSEICRCLRTIEGKGLCRRQLKRTKAGDFTDNTYFVVVRMIGRFFKKPKFTFFAIIAPIKKTVKPESTEFFVNYAVNSKKRRRKCSDFLPHGRLLPRYGVVGNLNCHYLTHCCLSYKRKK